MFTSDYLAVKNESYDSNYQPSTPPETGLDHKLTMLTPISKSSTSSSPVLQNLTHPSSNTSYQQPLSNPNYVNFYNNFNYNPNFHHHHYYYHPNYNEFGYPQQPPQYDANSNWYKKSEEAQKEFFNNYTPPPYLDCDFEIPNSQYIRPPPLIQDKNQPKCTEKSLENFEKQLESFLSSDNLSKENVNQTTSSAIDGFSWCCNESSSGIVESPIVSAVESGRKDKIFEDNSTKDSNGEVLENLVNFSKTKL